MISEEQEPVRDEGGFLIVESTAEQSIQNSIPVDARICERCRQELGDVTNRRFRYPFITCVDCGPRYTVLISFPFDRENTSMVQFDPCSKCREEYDDPSDRRFHAQTISCGSCGPRLKFKSSEGEAVGDDAVRRCVEVIRNGGIVGVKGLGGFQLLARADLETSVKRLRELKRRDAKPFAILVADLEIARSVALVDELSARAIDSVEGPIVLVPRKSQELISRSVAPDSKFLGLILPTTGLHQLIALDLGIPLVCTSANISDETILSEGDESAVSAMADALLTHDRIIQRHADDSVGRVICGEFSLIRRARGFAPRPIWLDEEAPTVLAVGAELKNTISLVSGRQAFTSVHVGDLGSHSSRRAFQNIIQDAVSMIDTTPSLVVCDMHPSYASTQFALDQQMAPVLQIQHHHAHVASCVAEHHVREAVLGVACDGLGWGPDGTAWGGEFLLVDGLSVKRVGHLRTTAMPGGVAAIREPWRMAVALLIDAGVSPFDVQSLTRSSEEIQSVMSLVAAPEQIRTSSTGRLFEGLAALILGRQANRYEGQLASALEQHCALDELIYSYAIDVGDRIQVDFRPLVSDVHNALLRKVRSEVIASGVHGTFVAAISDAVAHIASRHNFGAVVVTGGVFQNARLTTSLTLRLEGHGFKVFRHRQVPTNDGGISLGQAHLGRLALQSGRPLGLAVQSDW